MQARIAKTKRRAPKPHNGQKSIFADLLFCGDCHTKLRYHTNTINKDIHYFVCANNKVDYRGSCPGRHYVRADAIEQVVMMELRRMAEYLSDDEDAFAELLARKTDKELLKEQKRCEEELQKAMARNDTVSRLYEKLYEDNATGKVSDEWFMQLIDHIDVFETEGIGKNRTQRIVIYYRFVGYVEIPAAPRHPHYKADTRQGVAVEYLTEPKTA